MSSSIRKENPSYCYGDAKPRKASASVNDGDIDMICLNKALHELGMLSAITESRKQYLHENATRKVACASQEATKGFCVLRMNSDYVTDFSGMWKCRPLNSSASQSIEFNHSRTSDSNDSKFNVLSIRKDESGCCYGRAKSKLNRFRFHVQKPYNGPWMQRWESHEWFPHTMVQSEPPPKEGGSSVNRSNPGSPEKGPLEASNSLVRSRSLDDIENLPVSASNSELSLSGQKSEIETMSQKLEGLHVV